MSVREGVQHNLIFCHVLTDNVLLMSQAVSGDDVVKFTCVYHCSKSY